MLLAPLAHAARTDYASDRFRKAYAFLEREDLSALPLGRTDIDGDEVFALVSEYDTAPAPDLRMEAHRRYCDIHCMVSGEELIQYAPLEGLIEIGSFDEEADGGRYGTPPWCSSIVLRAGQLAVFAPGDAHKPGCSFGAAKPVRKVVVKVLA
ncbi:YhcH/YjgK/YiaL family protein [Rubneribacter sp.]